MKHPMVLLVLAAASFMCAAPIDDAETDDPGSEATADSADSADPADTTPIAKHWNGSPEAPGETIQIEGDAPPGSQGGAPWGPGPGHANGGQGGGGGGGHVSGEPEPIPQPKECRKDMGLEACLDCCMWNHLHVDTPTCGKKKTGEQRRRCREEAVQKLADCQVETCGRERYPGGGILAIPAPQ